MGAFGRVMADLCPYQPFRILRRHHRNTRRGLGVVILQSTIRTRIHDILRRDLSLSTDTRSPL